MDSPLRRILVCCLALFLAACASAPLADRAVSPQRSVLLVSLDGFRADQLDLGITPNLSRLAREGVRGRWMRPAYPSLTFPNHYSMVTGLVPDHHGVVHNTMADPALGGFKLSDREAVGDGRWWGGEPIWVLAERAGLRSATLFWPGSEAAVSGVRPTRWRRFDYAMTLDARVDTVVGWLSEPETTRPRIATLYFETVDHHSHAHGPDSPQAHAAIRAVDAALGRLLEGLDAHGRLDDTDLVIVSDHGMATVPAGHVVAVEDLATPEEATVVSAGQVVTLIPKPGHEAAVERRLLGAHRQYACWRKGELPSRWRYGTHPRIPSIVCQMREGWDAVPRASIAMRPAHDRGSHGYDPALPSMRALFVARGPGFRRGVVIEPFDNVDVYPLLARLLGIAPAAHDGDAGTWSQALVQDAVAR